MSEPPLVSVIIATHNGSLYLPESLTSVLAQDFTNFEVLIVDDASTDDTNSFLKSVQDSRVRVLHNQTRLGLTASLNVALKHVAGAYIARIDDDDLWVDTSKLRKQVEFLENHPTHAVCGTQYFVMDEHGRALYQLECGQSDEDIRQSILRSNQFAHSAVCIRTRALKAVGGYDQARRYSQDYELWLRLGAQYQLANLPEVGVAKRLHFQAISRQHHISQCMSFIRSAYQYRHEYPGFRSNIGIYARELFLNVMLPRTHWQRMVQWRQAMRKNNF